MKIFLAILALGSISYFLWPEPSLEEILGPDHDQNGVRDDVDHWIDTNIEHKYLKMAFRQYARAERNLLKEKSKDKAIMYYKLGSYASSCISDIHREIHRADHDRGIPLYSNERRLKREFNGFKQQLKYLDLSEEEKEEVLKEKEKEYLEAWKRNQKKYGALKKKSRQILNEQDRLMKSIDKLINNTSERKQRVRDVMSSAGTFFGVLETDYKKSCEFKINEDEL